MANEKGFDNIQGAPASLAIGDTGAPKSIQQAAEQAQSQIAQIANSGSANFSGLAPQGDFRQNQTRARNLAVLEQLAGNILKPQIEAKKQEMFDQGVVQAMQGRAIKEIADEQPWYSKIFGPSSSVDGARAMTALATSTDAAAQTMSAMKDLRTKSPEEMKSFLIGQKQQLLTGDAVTDAMVSKNLMETWQTTITQHAKQNYAYVQEQNNLSQADLITKNGKMLASLDAPGNIDDPVERNRVTEAFAASLSPLDGQDHESHMKNLTQVQKALLQDGNFKAANILKGSSYWTQLDTKTQTELENAQDSYEKKQASTHARDKYGDEFLHEHQRISAYARSPLGRASPEEVQRMTDEANNRYRKATGSSIGYLADSDTIALVDAASSTAEGEIKHQRTLAETEAKKVAELRAKQLKQVHEQTQAHAAFTGGLGQGPIDSAAMDAAALAEYDRLRSTPEGKLAAGNLVARNFVTGNKYKSDSVTQRINSNLMQNLGPGKEYNGSFEDGFQQWAAINQTSKEAALAYVGPEMQARMTKYQANVMLGRDPQKSFQMAMTQPIDYAAGERRHGSPEKFTASIASSVDSHFNSFSGAGGATGIFNWISEPDVNKTSKNLVTSYVENMVNVLGNDGVHSDKELADMAIKALPFERAGRYVTFHQPNQHAPNELVTYANSTGQKMTASKEDFGKLMSSHIEGYVTARGYNPDNAILYRLDDKVMKDGSVNPQYYVYVDDAGNGKGALSVPVDVQRDITPLFKQNIEKYRTDSVKQAQVKPVKQVVNNRREWPTN